ncbi:MAG: hypothetical protein IT460_11970 [Planctomycetes bacterium]|nr:hypothetical protein [Planctomycetota bacterium]
MSFGGRGFALVAALACAALVVCCFVGRMGRLHTPPDTPAAPDPGLGSAARTRFVDERDRPAVERPPAPRRLPSTRSLFVAASLAGIAAACGARGSLRPGLRRALFVGSAAGAWVVLGLTLLDVLDLADVTGDRWDRNAWAGDVSVALIFVLSQIALWASVRAARSVWAEAPGSPATNVRPRRIRAAPKASDAAG